MQPFYNPQNFKNQMEYQAKNVPSMNIGEHMMTSNG